MEEITLRRWDLPITIGLDTDEAVEFAMASARPGEPPSRRRPRRAPRRARANTLREGLADWALPSLQLAMASEPHTAERLCGRLRGMRAGSGFGMSLARGGRSCGARRAGLVATVSLRV